ncbi:MAG: hypothetical protein M0R74_19895, partial [Dehalococcoidia bacterium]|nr:hypothetical protein [Dehalococcoidia bacterium]
DDKEDDNSKEGPLSGGTGGDAQYVAAICKASREWWDQLSSAFMDIDPEKPEEFMKGLMEPTRTYADQIAKAKPPKDIQEWHENLVAMFKDVVKGMESGEDFISDDAFGDFPDMPLAAQERLVKVAEKNEDCQALEEDGGAIFQ